MCDPVTIGVTMSAVSTVAQGYSQMQQANYQAGVERYNARVLENEATKTRNVGIEAENEQRRATAELLARQRVQAAASGVNIGSGSALQLQTDTMNLGEVDALRIRSNYADQARSMEDQASLTRSRAGAIQSAGRSAFTGSLLSAAGGVMASGVADKWFTAKSAASQAVSGVVPLDLSKSMPNTFSNAGSLNLFP